jgi:hypothetical protein
LNVHFHALVLDGVFDGEPGKRRFCPLRRLTAIDVEEVLAAVERLVDRRCREPGGSEDGDADSWGHEAPVLAGLAAASVQGQAALGPRSGRSPTRWGTTAMVEAEAPVAETSARANGYSLHAGLVVPAGRRERLERVCRYVLRPPVAVERLHLTDDGRVRLSLRQPWRDGTTDFVFTPLEFLERLAVLVPRPRINLILYFGVLGARAAGRAEVTSRRETPTPDHAKRTDAATPAADSHEPDESTGGRNRSWATLMQRTSRASSRIWDCRPNFPCRDPRGHRQRHGCTGSPQPTTPAMRSLRPRRRRVSRRGQRVPSCSPVLGCTAS